MTEKSKELLFIEIGDYILDYFNGLDLDDEEIRQRTQEMLDSILPKVEEIENENKEYLISNAINGDFFSVKTIKKVEEYLNKYENDSEDITIFYGIEKKIQKKLTLK